MVNMSAPTISYTMAQVHRLLGNQVPKPTIRYWTTEYGEFLSGRANPGDGRNRVFDHNDLVVLNTIRHLTKEEGLNSVDDVKIALRSGRRATAFPQVLTDQEEEALQDVRLVPASDLARSLDQIQFLQQREGELSGQIRSLEEERDEALTMLAGRDRQIADLREERGHIRGTLLGITVAAGGVIIVAILAIIGMLFLVNQLVP